MPDNVWHAVEISAADTYPLRVVVLRAGTPTTDVRFHEDDWPGAFHLGIFDDGTLVGTSTWIPRECAGRAEVAAVQLRGMATLTSHHGRGVGSALIAAGIARAAHGGAQFVWANARDTALGFYLAHGFTVDGDIDGDGFVDAVTGLPHHRVVSADFRSVT